MAGPGYAGEGRDSKGKRLCPQNSRALLMVSATASPAAN